MPDENLSQQIKDAIAESVIAGNKSASADGVSVTKHGLKEQIEAARLLEAQRANAFGGMRLLKIRPGGTV